MRQKGTFLLPLIIAVAVVGLIGYIIFKNTQPSIRPLINPHDYPALPGDPHYTSPTPETSPTSTPTKASTTWKPGIELFTIKIPDVWVVTQSDGGAGSVISITSPDYNGGLDKGSMLEIKFGSLSGMYPDNLPQTSTTIGNHEANTLTNEDTVYYLINDIYSPKKGGDYNILIVLSTKDKNNETIVEILDSIIFEPAAEELNNSKFIP